MANTEWVRLTPEDEDSTILLVRKNDVGFDLASGFDDAGTMRRDVHRQPLFVTSDEALAFAAQLPEVKALVEALKWYATSGHYVESYKYRDGELFDVSSKASADSGEKARTALAAFEEALS